MAALLVFRMKNRSLPSVKSSWSSEWNRICAEQMSTIEWIRWRTNVTSKIYIPKLTRWNEKKYWNFQDNDCLWLSYLHWTSTSRQFRPCGHIKQTKRLSLMLTYPSRLSFMSTATGSFIWEQIGHWHDSGAKNSTLNHTCNCTSLFIRPALLSLCLVLELGGSSFSGHTHFWPCRSLP